MNPTVLDAFALIICAAAEPPAYPSIPGREPDFSAARGRVEAIEKAMNAMRKALPSVGSYLAESNFFDEAWRESFWGTNYARLLAVKDKYDPEGLFFVHHGVGSNAGARTASREWADLRVRCTLCPQEALQSIVTQAGLPENMLQAARRRIELLLSF